MLLLIKKIYFIFLIFFLYFFYEFFLFFHVPECSGMFRHVPECSMFGVLSTAYFGKHLFCKTKTDYAYKLRVQDFVTGKNFSFNQCSKQGSFAFLLGKVIL